MLSVFKSIFTFENSGKILEIDETIQPTGSSFSDYLTKARLSEPPSPKLGWAIFYLAILNKLE